ncbi:MarR family winged helix-turn-helix transcriptional regulator [Enterococcus gallinarum]|uniref:MarR family winged helix-turn-helix transcriptional regulator n=1 Tax=Enterococcus gallinarum TaxID=1353 RepID=UPI001D1754BD|nr:MarR family transcriptional regulator [Enterococcus gallinarum]MCC4046079.1 MarR family transcriptional regulator [Enterococcus gallinarum]
MNAPENPRHLLFGGTFILANKLQFAGDKSVTGLTTKQWFLLMNLRELSKVSVPSVNELASAMNTTRQNIAKMLDTMEKEGLVSVSQSAQDKRVKEVVITKKGQRLAKQSEKDSQEFRNKLFVDITEDELATASQVTLKMIENLERIIKEVDGNEG